MFNEENYRQEKTKNLENILGNICSNIDWIWVGSASRRKLTLQIDGKNRLGFFAEKSNNLVEIDEEPLAEKEISQLILPLKSFLKNQEQNLFSQAVLTLFDNGLDLVFVIKREMSFAQMQKLIAFAKEQNLNISYRYKSVAIPVFLSRKNQIFYPDFKIELGSEIFIQATKLGLAAIIKVIRNNLKTSERVADIYSGFGAYSFAIHDLAKNIFAFEGDKKMVDLLNKNAAQNDLGNKIKAEERDIFLNPLSPKELKNFDVVIINPPRNGANPQIIQISKSSVKKIIYVSCNPESFKRDAKILIDSGFKIPKITALDQFYSTKHLELISIFEK